ncbi:MAG TPA: UDP-N-acetylmuramoyl-L-alanyl-D-glutamate--2,6-diaminopimelate ligase [Parachlamydiales bacterium]|nr:UDP-N-acetylmuramoyl-L-alanyl-D-glutamate--2,6-diaminopimelate ligase [Parachlamydiales bacterium]
MKLKQLIKQLPDIQTRGSKEVEISGLSIDSRSVAPGHLFIAKKGLVCDGSRFIGQALRGGAFAIATDLYDPFISQPQIIHPDPASLVPLLASRFYQKPSQDLFVFGATGTKGKTTTTYLAKQLLEALGQKTGLIGGVETIVGDHRVPSTLTTHDVIFNQKWLREMVEQKCKAVSIEVSSHGLMQKRVDEIYFDAALFTNLSVDHLDYHETMEAYAQAKRRLFQLLDRSPKKKKRALLNGDSPWSSVLQQGLQTPYWTFGLEAPADIKAKNCVFGLEGTQFTVDFQGESVAFSTKLMGKFNLYNLLGAIALALHAGFPLKDLQGPVAQATGAPGRLQRVNSQVFVDHAHMGESLAQALSTLKVMTKKNLWVVFGCGGDRDPARRRLMAEAAECYADRVVVTTDNPRSEPPEEICRQIVAAFRKSEKVYVELDRRSAITYALSHLQEGDLLLIAGKGHEKVQIFAHKTVPFDDVAVVYDALSSMRS